jgi:DNA polymerase-4
VSKQDGRGRQVSADPVDDLTATILHVDMDAFYASVELLRRPELVGKPVIVGHASRRSVVTAATYEARRYGVNSAMSMALALQRCPQAIILEPHFEDYSRYSKIVMRLLGEFTPRVEPLSIDEAFLDVAGALRLYGTPWQIGTRIRSRIFEETGLRASVGAAATKYVAKLSSGLAKPNGLLVVPRDRTIETLHPLPVSALWGVGPKSVEQLERLGLRTVGEVAAVPLDALSRAVGPTNAARLQELAWGRDPRSVEDHRV